MRAKQLETKSKEENGMKENDKVWYACYGSNLCAERFMYYIVGGHCPFNDKDYDGCRDKTMWTESKIR